MLRIAYADIYKYELPEGHRFPMEKYELLPEQLLYEGTVNHENFFTPDVLSDEIILKTHSVNYLEKLHLQNLSRKEIRNIGFPMTPHLVKRGKYIANGTLQGAIFALQNGIALNIAGGTHHAYADRGEGFCVFNDIAIAASHLLEVGRVNRILIIDLDVHQGNGTAHIFRDENRVFTLSVHGAKNYPLRKEISDLDIGLPDKTGDDHYLKTIKNVIPSVVENFHPDIIFYLSGVDILEFDKLGRLSVTLYGCKERDRFVLDYCYQNKIPVMVSMGGGYAHHIRHIVEAHANTFRLAQEIFF
jgi:acetoin utilization deacetylase AcuC-like enzyme